MHQAFNWILGFSIALMIFSWVFRPLFVFVYVAVNMHAKQNLDPQAPAKVVELESMTPEARQQMEQLIEQFQQEGFESIGPAISYESEGMAKAAEKLLVNRAGDIATIVITTAELTRSHAFVIVSKLENGREIVSSFARSAGVIPESPHVEAINFGWVRNAHELSEVHRRRMAKLQLADASRIAPTAAEHLSFSRAERNQGLQRFENCGYMYPHKSSGLYRYTWKGALLMSLTLGRQVRQWRARRQEAAAREIWRELRMDEWQKSIATASPIDEAMISAVAEVEYQPQLRNGEVRMHTSVGVLTVRIGVESRGQFVASQWLGLFVIFVFSLVIASSAYILMNMPFRQPPQAYFWLLPAAVIVVAQTCMLLLGAMRRRGTITLMASQRALTYRNTPQWAPDGQIIREDIESIMVMLGKVSMRGKIFQLVLFPRLRSRMILAQHTSKEQLDQIRQALLEAMGIQTLVQLAAAPSAG